MHTPRPRSRRSHLCRRALQRLGGAALVLAGAGVFLGSSPAPSVSAGPTAHKERTTTVKTKTHKVEVVSPESVQRDKVAVATVRILPTKPWKLTTRFEPQLTVRCEEGVTIHNPKQGLKDAKKFEDHGGTFLVSFIANSAGTKQFRANITFALCTDQDCQPKKHELSWKLDVR